MNAAIEARTQVLIAGGGPAGLAAAIELGRRGIRCTVVEPRVTVDSTRPRAKTTSTRTMEHLRRWGIADRLRAAAPLPVAWSQDVIFATNLLGQELTRFHGAFGLSDPDGELSPETGQQVPQPVVETVLRQAVAELETVTVMTGYRLVRVVQDAERVLATVEPVDATAGPRVALVEAEYLLGCDGTGSICRAAIGTSYRGSSGEVPNLSILFRAPDLAGRVQLDPAVQYWIVNPLASGLMGRLDLDQTWWAIVQSVDPDSAALDPARLVRDLVGADIPLEVIATDPWHARMLLADNYRAGRTFLVGDAAHLNPPWGGHGFNTCVGDAANIGWKLAAVLQGWASPDLLDSYEAERRPVAAQTIADAGAQERLLAPSFAQNGAAAGGAAAESVRRGIAEALQAKASEFHSAGLVLGYHYAGSPAVVDDGSPVPDHDPISYHASARPGARLPHRWLSPGRSVYDVLGTGFTLLQSAGSAQVGAFVEAAARSRVPLTVVELPAALMRESYAASMLLVRPDQHVAWRGDRIEDPGSVLAAVCGFSAMVTSPVIAACESRP